MSKNQPSKKRKAVLQVVSFTAREFASVAKFYDVIPPSCSDCHLCDKEMWSTETENPGECKHPYIQKDGYAMMLDLDRPGRPDWCPLHIIPEMRKRHGRGASVHHFLTKFIEDHSTIGRVGLVLESGYISHMVKLCFYRDVVRRFCFVKRFVKEKIGVSDQFLMNDEGAHLRHWLTIRDPESWIEKEAETGKKIVCTLRAHDTMKACAEIMSWYCGKRAGQKHESRWFAKTLVHWMNIEKMAGQRMWSVLINDNMMARPADCLFDAAPSDD